LAEEALTILRELAAARPDAFRVEVATSLGNIAYLMAERGEFAAALPPAVEGLALLEREARRRAPAVRQHLVFSHCAAARCHEGLGDMVAAREAAANGLDALEDFLVRPRRLSRILAKAARHLLRIAGAVQAEAHERVHASLRVSDQAES
jgi:hypothetical protein